MNWDRIEGNWKEYSGKLKKRWGKLTDGDLTTIAGKREEFIGKLQQLYGMAKEEAEQQVTEFLQSEAEGEDDEPGGRSDWSGHSTGTH